MFLKVQTVHYKYMNSTEEAMETHPLGCSNSEEAALVLASLHIWFHALFINLVKWPNSGECQEKTSPLKCPRQESHRTLVGSIIPDPRVCSHLSIQTYWADIIDMTVICLHWLGCKQLMHSRTVKNNKLKLSGRPDDLSAKWPCPSLQELLTSCGSPEYTSFKDDIPMWFFPWKPSLWSILIWPWKLYIEMFLLKPRRKRLYSLSFSFLGLDTPNFV